MALPIFLEFEMDGGNNEAHSIFKRCGPAKEKAMKGDSLRN